MFSKKFVPQVLFVFIVASLVLAAYGTTTPAKAMTAATAVPRMMCEKSRCF